jgi:UDP-N-acetylglucosamine/UDP-N-acetylgalactosamine diphosphorylase
MQGTVETVPVRESTMETTNPIVKALIDKGVSIPDPVNVSIGDEVDPDRISGSGVIIYPGCRIRGGSTFIMAGVKLGQEGPVTVEDSQIGRDVELKGGYFRKSVFLKGSNMASGAHVRDACILEEEASCAHSVGLKHTILFPFVTLGSLINFCDCLMAGGTNRKNHSEVGSSYIHFNYTPNQDKATASLIGDVPRGVMLDQGPIFLGGQGGLVGPALIGYGTVIAAGIVFHGDVPEGGKLISGGQGNDQARKDFVPGLYLDIRRRTRINISYIANLIALKAWYRHVRRLFGTDEILLNGAVDKLDLAIDERALRLKALSEKMPHSIREYRSHLKDKVSQALVEQKEELFRNRDILADTIFSFRSYQGAASQRDAFLDALRKEVGTTENDYVKTMQGLSKQSRSLGTLWLQNIVGEITDACIEKIPLFR